MPSTTQPAARPAAIIAGLSVAAAVAWLCSRVWFGLDFADEMQYYGEIASIVRTNRLFQDDLFLQQLGYVFLLPFFKLHALVFPDQSYLVVFGRLLLLGAYGVAGALFWRAATRLGGFSTAHKLTGLAALFAWVPFQLFAFSYNSTPYLLSIALAANWLMRDPARFPRYAMLCSALLTVFTYTHPPGGVLLTFLCSVEAGWRFGPNAALRLAGTTLGFGLAVLGVIYSFHGVDFPHDLREALIFSGSFANGRIILTPYHLATCLTLLLMVGLFVWRIRSERTFKHPFGLACPVAVRWVSLCILIIGIAALLGLVANWKSGYLAVSGCLLLLLMLAASVPPADGRRPVLRPDDPALWRWSLLFTLTVGLAALLAVLLTSIHCLTGHFATTVFFVLLTFLVLPGGQPDGKNLAGLAVAGAVTGTMFAYASSNGLHNFGVGAAGTIPFLMLYAARHLSRIIPAPLPAALILPGVVLMLLSNGIVNPYRELMPWERFEPVRGVPAFVGIRTSPLKLRAISFFQQAAPRGTLRGKRILIVGPHPWLYFVLDGQPATPMLFMKFDGDPVAYEVAARRLFREGPPDVIMLTDTQMPPPFAQQIIAWSREKYSVQTIPLPLVFTRHFQLHVALGFAPEVHILKRLPAQP